MRTLQGNASIEEEGRQIVERLGGRWASTGGMCLCPAHDDRSPSLSVRPGRERLLLHCFAGCRADDILQAFQEKGLLKPNAVRPGSLDHVSRGVSMREAAERIWSEARNVRGTLAETYLVRRGLAGAASLAALRYHPRTPCGRGALVAFRPALIAACRDAGGLTGIHRTFLDPQTAGLASIAGPKRALGRLGAGSVRLHPAGRTLGLAEGIESALSASQLFGVPCWAVLGAARFAQIALPASVVRLLLFLDHDEAGRRAEALARAAFGAKAAVVAHYPKAPGADWNDVLRTGAGAP